MSEATSTDRKLFFGQFEVDGAGRAVPGELFLSGADSCLTLRDAEFLHAGSLDGVVRGRLFDGDHITLINCTVLCDVGSSSTRIGPRDGDEWETTYFVKLFPNRAVFGDRHLNPGGRCIKAVSVQLPDSSILFSGASGSSTFNLGEATLTTRRKPSEEVLLTLRFVEAVDFESAETEIFRLVDLIGLIVGRAQQIMGISLHVGDRDREDTLRLQLAFSYPHGEQSFVGPFFRPHDTLLSPASRPAEFEAVVGGWMRSNDVRWRARVPFFKVFGDRVSGADRLITAANMFDVLPPETLPLAEPLCNELAEIIDECKAKIKALGKNKSGRDKALNLLGLVDKPNLRRKVEHRSAIMLGRCGDRVPRLNEVLGHAVVGRNFFVHGSESRLDLLSDGGAVGVLTNALEFVFAAADLCEFGWDLERFSSDHRVGHPFREFLRTYRECLRRYIPEATDLAPARRSKRSRKRRRATAGGTAQ